MVPDELEGANLTQDAARVAYTPATHGGWLVHALMSSAVFAQLEAGTLGATIRGINIRDLKRASIAVPPRAEQSAIAAVLDRETTRIDALVAKVRDAISRLKELRTALISAAVTGKRRAGGGVRLMRLGHPGAGDQEPASRAPRPAVRQRPVAPSGRH